MSKGEQVAPQQDRPNAALRVQAVEDDASSPMKSTAFQCCAPPTYDCNRAATSRIPCGTHCCDVFTLGLAHATSSEPHAKSRRLAGLRFATDGVFVPHAKASLRTAEDFVSLVVAASFRNIPQSFCSPRDILLYRCFSSTHKNEHCFLNRSGVRVFSRAVRESQKTEHWTWTKFATQQELG